MVNKELLNILKNNNITPVLVGGYVRDKLINPSIQPKDIDIELYTTNSYDELVKVLNKYNPKIVGKHFGVIKIDIGEDEFDLSLPRTEKSIGDRHTDYEVIADGTLSYDIAFKRRDFTINAIGIDLTNDNLIDIYNGQDDIKNKIIRHVDNKTFVEDPLRIFRAIQFAARFNFEIATETKELIHNMIKNNLLDNLPKERVFTEFNKLLTKSSKPSIGFELMREFRILERYFPELHNLIDTPQEKKWHPEGDVWIHTMMSIDEMANLKLINIDNKLLYMYAVLCHDLGKPMFTKILENGYITSSGHEKGGIEPTIMFMNKLTNDKKLIQQITKLVELHLRPSLLYTANSKENAIKRLSNDLIDVNLTIIDLAIINLADSLGRTTKDALERNTPQYKWLINKFNSMNLTIKESPLIVGKDLINLGYKPGPDFKKILNECYNYQIEYSIKEKDVMLEELDNILESNLEVSEIS